MKNALTALGCSVLLAFGANAQDLQGEYFFDQDPGVGNGIALSMPTGPSPSLSTTLDITGLSPGVHFWYARSKQNGVWGFYGERRMFYIWDLNSVPASTPVDIEAAEYFFDQDPGPGNGIDLPISPSGSLNENVAVDITGLSPGVHLWHIRTKQNGAWGFYGERRLFYIWDPTSVPAPTPTDIEAAEYFFDQDPGPGNGTTLAISPGGSINESATIDITGLAPGTHLWYVRTKQNGAWGFYAERKLFFIWDPADLPGSSSDIEAAEYFIDADLGVGNGTPLAISAGPNPFANALIDVSGYSAGLHFWNVRVKQNGVWGLYGEQQPFTICDEDSDPIITFVPSGSCTNGTFTVDVTMPAVWAGDPFKVINNVNAQTDTLTAGESYTFGPFDTGTELLFTAGSSLDPMACTKQHHITLACWYEDSDGDGFGDPLSSMVAETQPSGFVSDDSDNCPSDINKIDPLICGCGVADIATVWYEDLDSDGFGDAAVSLPGHTCIQPTGFVMDNTDDCPGIFGLMGDACDDGNSYTVNDLIDGSCTCIGTPSTVVAVKVFLEGPYDPSTGLMHDSLRVKGLLPTADPYPGLGYVHTGIGNDGTTVAGAVFAVTGNDAIVDWVIVELRSMATPSLVVASRNALLQRDGDIVELDGVSPLDLEIIGGDLHVAVLHRNHLGVMTMNALALGPILSTVDLTDNVLPIYGTAALRSIAGSFPAEVLWAGDVTFDGTIKYTGGGNDRDPILVAIGGSIPTNTASGYLQADVNMDGIAKYIGSLNDRDPVLVNIGGSVPTNTRVEQIP